MKQDFFEAGYCYHVFNRGNNHENIFHETKNYLYFLRLMKHHLLPVCEIYSYCLMPNHFHLLIRIKDPEDLPEKYQDHLHQPFSNLFNAYSKAINKAYGRKGSLFQEHLHRKRINDERYLVQVIAYIHLNPVKHGFTREAHSWACSSYNIFLSDKKTALERKKVIDMFDDIENFIFWHNWNKLRVTGILEEIDKSDD